MAQHAKPNNIYHCEEARPQLSSSSTLVVKTVSGSWLIKGVKTPFDYGCRRQPSTIVDPVLGVLHGKVIGLGLGPTAPFFGRAEEKKAYLKDFK
jgi:hypothetical protein